jgi:type IV pilus assembly protein PilC
MATFNYVAKDSLGKLVTGTSEAENEQVLVRTLREKGFWVQKITTAREQERESEAGPRRQFVLFARVSGRDLAIFCRQFATMINAGVSLIRCLAVLEEQTTSIRLKEIIRDIQASVEAGETLSRSLARYPKVFSNLFVGLVRAGEVGGVLDETLNRLSVFLEEDQKLRRKIRATMTYPVLVLFFALAIVTMLVTFILPQFMEVFEDLDIKTLPMPTQILVDISNFVRHRWYILIALVILSIVAFTQYVRRRSGKRNWDWFKLKVPVFGKLNHKVGVARFCRTLSTLLISGVPILQALETTAGAIDNEILAEAILACRTAIREGERIGDPLQRSGLFPPMVVQMIAIGEETGSLDAMLSKVADFYESEVEAAVASLTAALEPVLIVGLGFIVGFIILAMFLPIIAAVDKLSQPNA